MLFTVALLRAAVMGRRRTVVLLAPPILLTLGLVVGALTVRDLSSAHVLASAAAPSMPTEYLGAGGRQADLMVRAIVSLGSEATLFALMAGLFAVVASAVAHAAPALGEVTASGACAVMGGAVSVLSSERVPGVTVRTGAAGGPGIVQQVPSLVRYGVPARPGRALRAH